MGEDADKTKRQQKSTIPDSIKRQPKHLKLQQSREEGYQHMEEARRQLFQDKPREGTHNLWQISRQGKGSRFKVETPQKTSRGSKQPPHKKPKHPPAAASELTEKMEQQLRRMVNQMSGEEPPPYIRSGTCSSKSLTRKRT